MEKLKLIKLLVLSGLSCGCVAEKESLGWEKHVIVENRQSLTAVALDVNGDDLLDVITSYTGKVSLYIAPDWTEEIVIHNFLSKPIKGQQNCIHSALLDVDQDGDLDWAGSMAHGHPFWLENPGKQELAQQEWTARGIDPEITGIHCLLASDIDNDGVDDLVINNFSPDQGIGDSIAWFKVPTNPHSASRWKRHIFAHGDARGGSHYMGAGDIDGDGWKEIAVCAKGKPFTYGNWIAYWKNPGEEGLVNAWEKVSLAENQQGATNILPADVNGDGKLDWVASRGHGVGVLWFENPGWNRHEVDPEIQCPHSLSGADFDQDGDLDLASCGFESKSVRWYENDGSGAFTIHSIDLDQESYDLRSIDMDNDGDLDLLNAGRGSKNVVWYENKGLE